MTAFKADLSGVPELQAAFDALTRATQKRVLERTLKKAAIPIRDAAKRFVPVKTGALRDSIEIIPVSLPSAGKAAFAAAMRNGMGRADAGVVAHVANRVAKGQGGPVAAAVRVKASAPYVAHVEWGTLKMPAQPFMRPAADFGRNTAFASIAEDLKREIDATAKRAAARKARKAR
jgi:HK97 gp10 family phage protein